LEDPTPKIQCEGSYSKSFIFFSVPIILFRKLRSKYFICVHIRHKTHFRALTPDSQIKLSDFRNPICKFLPKIPNFWAQTQITIICIFRQKYLICGLGQYNYYFLSPTAKSQLFFTSHNSYFEAPTQYHISVHPKK